MTYLRTCTIACECGRTISITVETQLPFSSEAGAAIDTELYLLGWTPDGPADDKCPACTEADA